MKIYIQLWLRVKLFRVKKERRVSLKHSWAAGSLASAVFVAEGSGAC